MSTIYFQSFLLLLFFCSSFSSPYRYSSSNHFFSSSFPLYFTSYRYNFFNPSSLLFYLTLPLFFLQPFPSLFGYSSLHHSTLYRYNSFNSSSPLFTLLLPIFFFFPYRFAVTSSTPLPSLSISPCSAHKKVITLLLSVNGFFFFF